MMASLESKIQSLAGIDHRQDITPDNPVADLLPSRLARACAQALAIEGAGVSLFGPTTRIPLGASDDEAEHAERLQFTVGDGPCWAAQATGTPVHADEPELARRWPMFHRELTRDTSYRAIVSVPLHDGTRQFGAMDLYFRNSSDMPRQEWPDGVTAGQIVASELSSYVAAPNPDSGAPNWMRNPTVVRRTRIWMAVGIVNLALDTSSADSLALLRSYSFGGARTLDDVVADIADRVLSPEELWVGAP
ncbi:GAF domain-containing protein [Nakamurella silvestris]|nr:GAF domain-containing protein [Nakamurella silvestris]